MMSRTVRVFKLMYIVAGILISNEEICDTVDRIQIAPRVEVKSDIELPSKSRQQRALTAAGEPTATSRRSSRLTLKGIAGGMLRRLTNHIYGRFSWLSKYDVRLMVQQWRLLAHGFDMWTIPNYLLEYTSSYISKKFFLNSDCDMIYK